MAYRGGKAKVNLTSSVNTENVTPIIYQFNDPAAKHLANTGIRKRGGIAPIYQNRTYLGPVSDSNTHSYFVADNGSVIHSAISDSRNTIYLDNKNLGTISSYGVSNRVGPINNFPNDVVLTATGTYLTATINGAVVTVSEFDTNQILLNTRSTTFTQLLNIPTNYTSLNFVRQSTMAFSQSLEFILRVGTNAFFLRENNPSNVTLRLSNLTNYYITQSAIYKSASDSYVAFGTIDGKVLSVDRLGNYKYPDGTGLGLGPYNNGTVIGSGPVTAMVTFNNTLVVSGNSGRTGSFDGNSWKNYDSSGFGTGIYDNQLILGARNINALATYGDTASWLIFAGDSGTVGSYALSDGWHYSTSAGKGPWLGANSTITNSLALVKRNIRAIAYSKLTNSTAGVTRRYLFVVADSGFIASFRGDTWIYATSGGGHGNSIPATYSSDSVSGALGKRTFRSATTYNNFFVVGADSGYIASYGDSNGWKSATGLGTGKGPYSNQTAIGNYNVTFLNTSGFTNLIFNGTCESASAPYFSLSLGSSNENSVTSQSSVVAHSGTYSLLYTKSSALGTAATYNFTIGYYNSLNGFIIGHTYTFGAWVYVPSGNGVTQSRFDVYAVINGVGHTFVTAGVNCGLTNQWQYITMTFTLPVGTTVAELRFVQDAGNVAQNAICYLDDVTLTDITANPGGQISSVSYLIAQGPGRMGTWNGSVWAGYNGIYTEGLYNSGDATHQLLGSGTITASTTYTTGGDTYYVIGGSNGAIASFDLANGWWKHYDGTKSGTSNGPSNIGSTVNNQSIKALLVSGTKLIVVTANYVASYDGSNWKNYDGTGTGTGPYDNNTLMNGNEPIKDAIVA